MESASLKWVTTLEAPLPDPMLAKEEYVSTPIVYRSKYSIICELVGHPKPSSQQEEDYCQLVERQNDTSVYVQIEMLTAYLNKLKNRAAKISGKPRQSRSISLLFGFFYIHWGCENL